MTTHFLYFSLPDGFSPHGAVPLTPCAGKTCKKYINKSEIMNTLKLADVSHELSLLHGGDERREVPQDMPNPDPQRQGEKKVTQAAFLLTCF